MCKQGILLALARASEDIDFYGELTQNYSSALKNYEVTQEEAMRIGTGDINWLEAHIKEKLDIRIKEKVFKPLLSREIW